MIPLGDNLKRRLPPVVTLALIAANVVAYAALGPEHFIPASVPLLAVNVVVLWVLGSTVEDSMSRWRYGALYVAAVYLLGAEGAVATVIGAYALLYPRARVVIVTLIPTLATVIEVPALLIIAIWAAAEIALLGVVGAGGYLSVLGGFAVGMVLARPLANRPHTGLEQDSGRVPVY